MSAPNRQPTTYSIVLAIVILATFLGLRAWQLADARRPHYAEIAVAGHVWRAELADTEAKRTQGLSGRDALASAAAMYFPMPAADLWSFWMKDMRFPLDIIWIRDNKVVGVAPDLPPPQPGESPRVVAPTEPADAVLELNAGQAAKYGIKPGIDISIRP